MKGKLYALTVAALILFVVGPSTASSLDMPLEGITPGRMKQLFEDLAAFTDSAPPSVTRLVFTDTDMQARKHIKQLMTDAGLIIREDAMGNIFGRWQGSDPDAGVVLSGSHSDSIVLGGRYDGTVGVLGAISAIKALREAGFKPVKSIEAIMFSTEEASRFNIPCLGSRGITGHLDPSILDSYKDENGTSFAEAARAVGYAAASAQEFADKTHWKRTGLKIDAFVELHIEQGPHLEAEGFDIGIVEAIAAPSMIRVEFTGKGGHGGGMPMLQRNDPSMAAAELALTIEKAALGTGASETVATVGLWDQSPNIYNAIPRKVQLDIDIRDTVGERRDSVIQTAFDSAAEIAARRKCGFSTKTLFAYPPGTGDERILNAIENASNKLGLSSKRMISRGYHDAGLIAQIAPTAMIFIPCRDGLSHHPDEYASPEQIANGVKILALTLAQLAGSPSSEGKDEL
ncbi:ureidoglycolate amidohydrolase [Klebsormidium nitens]|uniref:Ureidoglycolate amidohydrolase n=1 Tax=Klebsormidium nitens TaxID=105231 RepID=A0A1Y1HYB7_KLENI|nr:ureidoglycolate amidohydrolase [Klebsormidium nitens]|eukprot:GAQ80848.1 ureidoglycolate amidohydrolase [Klebsormidium nitens]